jgi:Kdo2-lipid IVA lauroyltransferase/acyltransferase
MLRRALSCLLAGVARLAALLPRRATLSLGRVLGALAYHVFRIRRRVTLENLAGALALPEPERRRIARRAYDHLCTGAIEFLQLRRLTAPLARELVGAALPTIGRLLEGGRGLLVLTGHLGNWDLLACAAALCGVKLHVVTRSIRSRWINDLWMAQRRALGVELHPASGSALAIRAALRRNEVVALVLDQHDPQGVAVPFFGRPAYTSTALARLAIAARAPVLPAFLLRSGEGFTLQLGSVVELERSGDPRVDAVVGTAALTLVLEDAIRTAPQQWLWLHRRWKASARGINPP